MNQLITQSAGLLDAPGSSTASRPESIRGTPYEVETTAVVESGIFDLGDFLGISCQPELEGFSQKGGK
jgi:hypothetical protein